MADLFNGVPPGMSADEAFDEEVNMTDIADGRVALAAQIAAEALARRKACTDMMRLFPLVPLAYHSLATTILAMLSPATRKLAEVLQDRSPSLSMRRHLAMT